MNSFFYAQMFIDIINEHDKEELQPLVNGLCLALAAVMVETKTPEDEAISSFERALGYCTERLKEKRQH
jgi:hypothetical protein